MSEPRSKRVTLAARDGGSFGAYLAAPPSGRGPGIVLIQEIFGVNAYMRFVADGYAAHGFTVLCPDLFWRIEPGVDLTDRTEEEWKKGIGLMERMDGKLAVEDCAAAIDFLRSHAACSGPVGALGYCMGGRLAFLVAARHAPAAAVSYYGVGIENLLGEAGGIGAPLMLHLAGKDAHCPPSAQAAIHRALDGNPLVTIHDYPDHDHAFARPGGRHHEARAAELADLRSLAFFVKHLGAAQASLPALWEEHIRHEFETRDTEATLGTMVEDAYVNHVPVLTGGVGRAQLREFYAKRFIPKMPPDTTLSPVSRTVGADQLVDEMVFEFTHTIAMDWMLPGVAPTGKKVSVPLVVIVRFRGDKLAHEHIYWDQASVLAQIGLLDEGALPIAGVRSARKVLEPSAIPSNELIDRSRKRA